MNKFFEETLFTNNQVCTFHDDVIIDKIPCNITLKYYDDGRIRLILHHKNILKKLGELLNDEDDEYLYNLIEEPILFKMGHHMSITDSPQGCDLLGSKSRFVMEQLNIAIQNIRFCKYRGKFIHKDTVYYSSIRDQIHVFFKDNTNIQFSDEDDGDKCCICYESTITTGCCTHPICIPCAIQIKSDEDGDILCPICRDVLAFV